MIKPEDWKIEEMPIETEKFFSGRKLRPNEYSKLKMGLKPSSMDDKWFVYSQTDSVHFHRSWLGHCIFIARFEIKKDDIFLGEVIANKKPDQFGTNDINIKKEMFNKLVDFVLRQ